MMRTSSSRALLRTAAKPSTLCRAASGHAISNPTLANIEKRWESMPSREQADLWMALRDRMKENWNDLTLAEKKAGESRHCPTDDTQHPRSRRPSQKSTITTPALPSNGGWIALTGRGQWTLRGAGKAGGLFIACRGIAI